MSTVYYWNTFCPTKFGTGASESVGDDAKAMGFTRVMVCTEKALMDFGVVRFNELKKYIRTISYKTLSATLKELEADGLVHREEYPQIPPKVEYSLTDRGRSLIPILDQMCTWGDENRM